MKKLPISVIVLMVVVAMSCGCASILEDEVTIISTHIDQQPERPSKEQIDVSKYDELVWEILNLVKEHETSGRIRAYSYDGEVETDVEKACFKIKNDSTLGVYAVSDITYTTTKIVSYYEIEVNIEYRRTKQQVDSITDISTMRYWGTALLNIISECSEEAVFKTSLSVTEEDIEQLVEETYYVNPGKIVMKPVIEVVIYQTSEDYKIIEVRFGYAGVLRGHASTLASYVSWNTSKTVGKLDEEVLISLAEILMAACEYDEGMAKTISVYGAQNFAVTAYGALVGGSAVGEGYAMAFKALCDELNFECDVVLGTLNERIHAWNIVKLYGFYYHIDVAMCDVNGMETAFLKTDTDFINDGYEWDREDTYICNGSMTYEDIVGTEEIPGDVNGEPGEQSAGQTDNETGNTQEPTGSETTNIQGPSGNGDSNTGKPSDNGNSQATNSSDNGLGDTDEPSDENTND